MTRLLHNYTSASHSFSGLYSTITVLGGTLHHATIHIFPIAIVRPFLHISLLHKALLYCTLTTHDTTHLRQTKTKQHRTVWYLDKTYRTKPHMTPLHLYHTTRYTSVPYSTSPLHCILYPTKPYPYFSAQNIASLHRYRTWPYFTILYPDWTVPHPTIPWRYKTEQHPTLQHHNFTLLVSTYHYTSIPQITILNHY